MTTATVEKPATVIGELELNENAVGVRPCIATRELAAGDTLFASGFVGGGAWRRVAEVRIVDGAAYIRVKEGWYVWRRVYCHVAAF
jgi:hypothetical protein